MYWNFLHLDVLQQVPGFLPYNISVESLLPAYSLIPQIHSQLICSFSCIWQFFFFFFTVFVTSWDRRYINSCEENHKAKEMWFPHCHRCTYFYPSLHSILDLNCKNSYPSRITNHYILSPQINVRSLVEDALSLSSLPVCGLLNNLSSFGALILNKIKKWPVKIKNSIGGSISGT